jgi:hypothetical protein
VDAFVRGPGPAVEKLLSRYVDRVGVGLAQLVRDELRKVAAKPSYGEVVALAEFANVRIGRPRSSRDRFGAFQKGIGYEGFKKSLDAQDWFDSSPKREVASILDDEETIEVWVRLEVGDLPILWIGARDYNPDFIAVDREMSPERCGGQRTRFILARGAQHGNETRPVDAVDYLLRARDRSGHRGDLHPHWPNNAPSRHAHAHCCGARDASGGDPGGVLARRLEGAGTAETRPP